MTDARTLEVNFDGLIGPTHNYSGLAQGNLAAAANEGLISNPRDAALQGLAKMRMLLSLGVPQAVLPPHDRPHVGALRAMGFAGSDAAIVAQAAAASPLLLTNVSSASAMWTANAATVTPSADAEDGRLHLTPANLSSHFHRAIEAETTMRFLARIFADPARFSMHPPVPFAQFGDEGAANHCRLSADHGAPGLEMFVYGRSAFEKPRAGFPARQTLEACHIVATTHCTRRGGALMERQSDAAIDAGAFHNDVVAVSNGPVLLAHAQAFADRRGVRERLERAGERLGFTPVLIEAETDELTLHDAVSSYVFNSQLVTRHDGRMALILPAEAEENPAARRFVARLLAEDNPIAEAVHVDLRQSMRNGGGPACLRLRIVLTTEERAAMHSGVMLDEGKVAALEAVVRRRYRDSLAPADLADPALLAESRAALDEISAILDLGSVYEFQRI